MSTEVYNQMVAGIGIRVTRYCGPMRPDDATRVMVQVDIGVGTAQQRTQRFTLDEWLAIGAAAHNLYYTNLLPICYDTACPNSAALRAPHAKRTSCPGILDSISQAEADQAYAEAQAENNAAADLDPDWPGHCD